MEASTPLTRASRHRRAAHPHRNSEEPDYWTPEELEAAAQRWRLEHGNNSSRPRSHTWTQTLTGQPLTVPGHRLHVLSADTRPIGREYLGPGALLYQANCPACRWHHISDSENAAVEALHDHGMRARRSGSHQRGLATKVAFTVPSALGKTATEHVDVFTPPKRSKTSRKSHLNLLSPSAASGDQKDAAPPRATTRRVPAARRAGTRLGEDLRKIIAWLRTERPGRLGPPLARFATAPVPWTAQDRGRQQGGPSQRR